MPGFSHSRANLLAYIDNIRRNGGTDPIPPESLWRPIAFISSLFGDTWEGFLEKHKVWTSYSDDNPCSPYEDWFEDGLKAWVERRSEAP